MFDFLQEASDALASKSAPAHPYALDPDLWRFHRLNVAIRPSGVVHVTFKPQGGDEPNWGSEFGKDLTDLTDLLNNGSRVMLDFEGVQAFDADAISKLGTFDSKLKNRGSRIVLCNLDPTVRSSFFPHLKEN